MELAFILLLKNLEQMLEAVKQNSCAIQYINREFRTNEIMYEAVKQNKEMIKSIPIEFRTTEMYQLLVNTDYHTIIPGKYIKYNFNDDQCCNDELKNQCNNLNDKYDNLNNKYDDLNNKYNDLNDKYEKLIKSLMK